MNAPITIQNVDTFFSQKTQPCTTSVVYLNKQGMRKIATKLHAKKVDDDCHLFYTHVLTPQASYYYIYCDLLQQLIVWSKDPRAFGKNGFLGTHLTIGGDLLLGNLDIHETIYYPFIDQSKNLLINKQKSVVRFKQTATGHLQCTTRGRPSQHITAKAIWNDICCYAMPDAVPNIVPGGARYKKKKLPMMEAEPTDVAPSEHWTIASMQEFISTWATARIFSTGVIRLPYIVRTRMNDVADLILAVVGDRPCMLVSDSSGRCSLLMFGI
jgi:hypothetical protein